uniref:DUF4283 domain-containing protein n=1 Tax=Brassica oleracea var. oleracea TaxID=109376 RepID=A0A0D3BGQ3_BRAOL
MAPLDDGDSEGENPSGGGGGGSVSTCTKEGDLVCVPVRDSESREVQGGTLNFDKEGKQEESEGGRLGDTVDSPISIKDDASKTDSPWLKNSQAGPSEPVIEVVEGVASMQIPEDIFDGSELLWKSFVVGYFIGDAPHISSVHATVNRIWSSPKAGSKIDVQFIEKNTFLFRIDNSQMRTPVLQRKYWHIRDVPLVVNVWSLESALNPPDLTSMPLWVDLCGVSNDLYSHKCLKCLTRAVGRFVKLHPNTERLNLHEPLVEKITFKDKEGLEREIGVNFPWLPPRCTVCRKWGHKGQDCTGKDVKLLKKQEEGEKGKQGGNSVDVAKDIGLDCRALIDINHKAFEEQHLRAREKAQGIQLIEPTTEAFHTADTGSWENVHGRRKGTEVGGSQSHQGSLQKRYTDEKGIAVSPSRFSPLQDINEDEEEEKEELLKEVEDGKILESKAAGKKIHRTQVMSGRRSAASGKQTRSKVARSKDLLYVGLQGTSKKASGRKL